ncbi:TetR/AcrR family transcriptional regulator [Gordonia sp. NB41Y]|uniref:TetR/AcrR family transcriptional regulator n=1 Tax=Gordonia sp. NB41Y TaxID=875808 RepID=UPI00273CC0E1|nr:TetR/AcrR family transcriptional regulator [Gordonia sp. NB41Y]WLP88522.1 TetR/AcrR family transcriptional regulator [Gordonia sp. NB41Y]
MARPNVEAVRKEQILRSALQQLSERGVVGLRVSDVAKGAGVSGGIVHYYFDTKLDLIRAAFEENASQSLERRAAIFADESADVRTTLYDLIDTYLPADETTRESWRVWIEWWAAAQRDEALADVHNRAYEVWAQRMQAVFDRVDGADPETSRTNAHTLMALLDGLTIQALMGSSVMSIDHMRQLCRHTVDLLLGDC